MYLFGFQSSKRDGKKVKMFYYNSVRSDHFYNKVDPVADLKQVTFNIFNPHIPPFTQCNSKKHGNDPFFLASPFLSLELTFDVLLSRKFSLKKVALSTASYGAINISGKSWNYQCNRLLLFFY